MDIKIREAVYEDYEEVLELVRQVQKLHVENRPDVYYDTKVPLEKERFKAVIDGEDKLFVVESQGRLVAYSIVRIMESQGLSIIKRNKFLYIEDICVDASMKKRGIGKRLFQHIKEYGAEKKVSSIQLSVWEFNKAAIKFYEALGMNTRNRRMELPINNKE